MRVSLPKTTPRRTDGNCSMNDEETPDESIGRRELLVVLGAGAVTTSGIAYAAMDWSTNSEQPVPETDPEQSTPETDQPPGENIEDFGATPGIDTEAVARENTEAIRSAAQEAGEHGTLYVPEGEYFFGIADQSFMFRFGHEQPKGISLLGAGPRQSKLILTSTVDPASSYRAFRYEEEDLDGENIDHGAVAARDISFDGNYEELDMNPGNTIWGYYAYGDGHFSLDNVRIRGWWANGSKFSGPSARIRRLTFEENAIGVAQAGDESGVGHHIVANPPDDSSILIEDCEFQGCSGTVINRRQGSGDVTLRRVWIRGVGASCLKMSDTNGTTRIENTYIEPRSDWIVQNLPEGFGNRGRWVMHRTAGSEYTPTVVLDNVVARRMSRNFILCYRDRDIVLQGTDIAIHNAAMDEVRYTRGAIRADNGIELDIGTMSVHNTNGEVFDTPDATGSVDTLLRGGNDGLGDIGNLSLGDNPNSGYLQPDVVSRDEVGIDSGGGASQQ